LEDLLIIQQSIERISARMDKMKTRKLFVHTALQARTPPNLQKKKCEGVVVNPITLAGILFWMTTTTTTFSSGCTCRVIWQEAEDKEAEQLQRGKSY